MLSFRIRIILPVVILGLLAIILAQEPPFPKFYEQYNNSAEIALAIDTATEEIMLVTDTLDTKNIAEAIRKAVVERGVEVYLLTLAETVDKDANYITSLTLAGAAVRLGPVEGAMLIIDRKLTITGPMISTLATEYDIPTLAMKDEDFTLYYADAFRTVFVESEIYEPNL